MFKEMNFNIYTNDYTYQRNVNHATKDFEERLNRCYGSKKAFLMSSCMEAITALFEYLLPEGGNVLIDRYVYRETKQYFDFIKRYRVKEIDFHDYEQIEKYVDDYDVLYLDNPSFFMELYDIEKIAEIAHAHGKKLIVDNTLLSFYYMNPIVCGADYCVESYTKYIGGHGDVIAGGLICREEPKEDLYWFLGRRGRMVNAATVYLLERSMKTLQLRMNKHTENGKFVYYKLLENGVSAWYPGYGGCILIRAKSADDKPSFKYFKKIPIFGLTFSTVNFIRGPILTGSEYFIRLSCGLEDAGLLWMDVSRTILNGKGIGMEETWLTNISD